MYYSPVVFGRHMDLDHIKIPCSDNTGLSGKPIHSYRHIYGMLYITDSEEYYVIQKAMSSFSFSIRADMPVTSSGDKKKAVATSDMIAISFTGCS